MKTRNSFVSNSSSSSFIVDLNKKEVQDIVKKITMSNTKYNGLARYTAVFDYYTFKEFDQDYYESFGQKLLPKHMYEYLKKNSNILYIRINDGGYGGDLCDDLDEVYKIEKELSKVCEWEEEYH